jgi:phage shock protein A
MKNKLWQLWQLLEKYFNRVLLKHSEYAELMQHVTQLEKECSSLELLVTSLRQLNQNHAELVLDVIEEQVQADISKHSNDSAYGHGVQRMQRVREEILKRMGAYGG